MHIPAWLILGVGVVVCVWGAYRIRIAFRSDEEDERARARKGLYAMARRTHLLVGIVYLLLGGALIATAFGWNPIAGMIRPRSDAPGKTPPSTELTPSKAPAPSTESAPGKAPAPSTESAPGKAPAPSTESAPGKN